MELNQLSSQIIKAGGNYLRLSKKLLGLFINFNEAMLKDGITRIIKHHLWDPCPPSLSLRRGGRVCELKRFRSIGRAGERIFAQGSDVKEADIHFTNSRLVWLPFMEKGIYLRESQTDFALQKNALELN